MLGELFVQWVQIPCRGGHVARAAGAVERCQLQAQARGVLRLYARSLAGTEKGFDAFVPERSNHVASV